MTKTILFFLLALATLICHTFVERYEKNGPQMLTSDWKSSVSKDTKISNNELFLSSKNSGNSVQIRQDIIDFKPLLLPGNILMLSADMKYTDVISGEKPWNRARLLLVQNDGLKDRWDYFHAVGSFVGTQDWKGYNKIFNVEEDTKHIRVTAQLSRCTGSFRLKNLQLYPVQQTLAYTWVQRIILFSWGLFAVVLLGSCFGNGTNLLIFKILLMVSFIVIISGTTMPQKVRNQISQEVTNQIQKTSNGVQLGFSIDPAKLGHFVFFTLFGGLLFLLMGKDPILGVAFNIVLLAAGTELAQFFIDGRSPLFTDFFIDLAGGVCGLFLGQLASAGYFNFHY
ncbi:MAG: VanZ family protein [Desulfobacula sp.]|nr:VanZ family protein [Desulfobacula sp.]